MRILLAICLFAFSLAVPAQAQGFRQFEEERFGTTALVPANWRRLPPDSRWEGTRFLAPDGQGWVVIYGVPATGGAGEHLRTMSVLPGERVTYRRLADRWFVVSGVKGDRIFYRRGLRACRGKVWHHLAFEYPSEQKRAYDRIVTAVSRSLQPGDSNEDCP
jgi:hypothetical protein